MKQQPKPPPKYTESKGKKPKSKSERKKESENSRRDAVLILLYLFHLAGASSKQFENGFCSVIRLVFLSSITISLRSTSFDVAFYVSIKIVFSYRHFTYTHTHTSNSEVPANSMLTLSIVVTPQ